MDQWGALFCCVLKTVCLTVTLVALAFPGFAGSYGEVRGRGHVLTDARTLSVGGRALRLYGIEVPSGDQVCTGPQGQWQCGVAARSAMAYIVQSYEVSCQIIGFAVDRVPWARCHRADGDIAEMLVREGFAVSNLTQDDAYVAVEGVARAARVGIWRGVSLNDTHGHNPITRPITKFQEGIQTPNISSQQVPPPCRVKGVRLAGRRVAVSPERPEYATVAVDPRKGDMWFCSLSDALFAGYPDIATLQRDEHERP